MKKSEDMIKNLIFWNKGVKIKLKSFFITFPLRVKHLTPKNEKINFNAAKMLIRRSRRMIQQNKLTFVIIDLDSKSRIHKGVLEFIDRVLYNNNFPVLINR